MEDFSLSLDWAGRDIISVVAGIVTGILIFLVGRWLARLVSSLVARSMTRAEIDTTVTRFAQVLVYVGLLVVVIIAALETAGIHTTSLTALLASAGLAIGLALKDSLSNFASGIMILLNKPYRVGDFVEAAGTGGSVEEVGIFNTILRTPDNIRVIVPNSLVTADNIRNYNANDTRRVDFVTGIGYEDNIGEARNLLMEIMVSYAFVLPEPVPTVEVLELGDSSVNLAVRCWTRTENYWKTRCDILEQIKTRLETAGISIPYPQHEVYLHTLGLPAGSSPTAVTAD